MSNLVETYCKQIRGTLTCLDRVVLMGTLPGVCYAAGMASYLYNRKILLKDYTQFAEPLRDELRGHIDKTVKEQGCKIEFIRNSDSFRKEDRIKKIIDQRKLTSGFVHVFGAMEGCSTFRYNYDKFTGKSSLRGDTSKCTHYYVYYLHEKFGLIYLRMPTWAPFRLQFYCNGHNWLAKQLEKENIPYEQLDNAFVNIGNWQRAQEIANTFPLEELHHALDDLVAQFCPIVRHFENSYHWSMMQIECATDIVFNKQEELAPLYDALVHTAIHAVKSDNVATFLGRKLHPNYQDEVGNNFHTRIEGTRIKHHMGQASLKMYDKQGLVLRIETTANDVSFFQHYRTVEHRDGTTEKKVAPVKKTIYSLNALQEIMTACNRRYLAFLSALIVPTVGMKKVEDLATSVQFNDRKYRGFNLFSTCDLNLFRTLLRGETALGCLRNKWLRRHLPELSGSQVSGMLKRLHLHGLIKKIGHSYKYHLTVLGREVATTVLKLRELVVIPSLANLLPD